MGYNTQGRCDVIDSQNCEGKAFIIIRITLYLTKIAIRVIMSLALEKSTFLIILQLFIALRVSLKHKTVSLFLKFTCYCY